MKKLKKFIFKFSKKIIFKYLMTFSLIFTILFSSIYSCVSVSYGAEVLAAGAKIVGYIGSTLGIVDKATGGGVTKMGGSTTSKIEQWWADNFNSGEIYKNSSGEYVFSGTATQELYNALDSDSSIDARVISSFSGSRSIMKNVSAGFMVPINSFLADKKIKHFAIFSTCVTYKDGNPDNEKTIYYTKALVCDLTNVAYIVISNSGNYTFYNSNGSKVTVWVGACYQKYITTESGDDDSFGGVAFDSRPSNCITLYGCSNSAGYNESFYPYLAYDNSNTTITDNFFYRKFSSLPSGSVYCNKSLIVAQNGASAMSIMSGGSRVINNYYTTLPTVSSDTINNNDWDSIYNSYVNNVSNESNTYYNSETDSYDDTALREAMKKYTDNIENAISSGAQDIAKQVDYLNEWMSKIYTLLGQIADLIDQNESGGTSGATDLSTVEGKLTAIQNYLETISGDTLEIKNLVSNLEDINNQLTSMQGDLDYIEDNYVILSNIYNYMLANPWGGSGHFKDPTDQPYDKWFKYLDDDDFPYGEILSKYNVLEQLLKGVAPFCFFAFASLVVNSLDVPAVEPIFDIPIQMDNALISVDENLTIDLTIFDSILPVTNALIIILWTMVLLWSSFYLISHLLTILQL